jgi:Zn finger protein HypA/HybF involved in hydrogenase expression
MPTKQINTMTKSYTIRCTHCNHTWKYKGSLIYTTCPCCQMKTKTKIIYPR